MKIGLLQCNFNSNDIPHNIEILYKAIERAATEGADLCVSSELALCGCPANGQFVRKAFIELCRVKLQELAVRLCENKLPAVLVGCPVLNLEPQGKALHNGAVFLRDGKFMVIARKVLHNRNDAYYFEPGMACGVLQHGGWRFAVAVGEDVWNDRGFWHGRRQYNSDPVEEFMTGGADALLNLTGIPFSVGGRDLHRKVLSWLSSKYRTPVVSVNQVGGMDSNIYPGGSMVFNANGSLCAEAAAFKEDVLVVDLDNLLTNNQVEYSAEKEINATEEIWNALVLGVRDFVLKCGFSKAVLGLSGGMDSSLVAAIAVEALGSENVLGVLMPSPNSSKGSLEDSFKLAKNLNMDTRVIPIDSAMKTFAGMLEQHFAGRKPDTTEENIQSRIRSVVLMAFTNKFNYILLNTGNKSEVAMGHYTFYGDVGGAVAVIADLYKTDVYKLAEWLNKTRGFELIPKEIIEKAPSAELRPGQKDSDSLPEYPVLDALLKAYLEDGNDEAELIDRGFDGGMVKHTLQSLRRSEFKRRQSPPVLCISGYAFGQNGKEPIATSFK